MLLVSGMLVSATASADADTIRSLTAAALDLDQNARLVEDGVATANGNVDLYIGDRIDGMLLHHVRVQIDDERAAQYDYSEAEATALSKGGMQRLLSLPLAAGTHRVRVEYIARRAQNLPSDDLIRGKLDQKIETSLTARWIEAELVSQGMVNKTPEMKLRSLSATTASAAPPSADDAVRATSFGIGSDEDPRVRFSRFLTAENRPFSAASELMHIQASNQSTSLPASFSSHLASVLADLGQSSRAEAAADPSDSLAGSAQSITAHYQSAIQQLADGNSAQAMPTLDQLGQIKPVDSAGWALRDEANLNLGYAQLHSGQATAAITSFGRVRSQGAFSARALLGMGWAYLDSGGGNVKADAAKPVRDASDIRPAFVSDVEARQGRGKLHFTTASSDQMQVLRRALVPWTELIGRNPMDPAVQEGLVAIGYGLDHVGAYVDAQLFYKRSVKLQETTLVRLDEARAEVNDGRMLAAVQQGAGNNSESGWHWQLPSVADDSHWWLTLNDDPKVQANFYFDELLAEPKFNNAFSEYRGLQNLIATGDEHVRLLANSGGDSAGLQQQLQTLNAQLMSALAVSGEQLKAATLADLQQEQKQAQAYLVEARFALARSNDWAPTELARK